MFDFDFMDLALIEANKAKDLNEIPIGCVITLENEIIAKAHNIGFWHAEILCIQKAQEKIGKYLNGCKIYCTAKPCKMCQGAIELARFELVIYGCDLNYPVCEVEKIGLVKEKECSYLLKNFFSKKR
jgi:tRNA(adenine34) deaminase